MKQQQNPEGFSLPEGPVRWDWKVCLTVTFNSAAVILNEVSEYFVDITNLLVKDFEARREDLIRLELESLDEE